MLFRALAEVVTPTQTLLRQCAKGKCLILVGPLGLQNKKTGTPKEGHHPLASSRYASYNTELLLSLGRVAGTRLVAKASHSQVPHVSVTMV